MKVSKQYVCHKCKAVGYVYEGLDGFYGSPTDVQIGCKHEWERVTKPTISPIKMLAAKQRKNHRKVTVKEN